MKPAFHIKPSKGFQFLDIRELSQYRDLLFFLTARNITVKYKQTVLGGLWAVIQPFFMMVVFTIFFGKLAKIPSDGVPYPVFNFSAMVAWTYFSQAVTQSGTSIVGEGNLISKVYFPRIIIPVVHILSGLLDFIIAFVVLLGMIFYYDIRPTIYILTLPCLVLLMVCAASGTGMILAALNAKYRDIKYTIPFLVQMWLFASPIVYPTSMIPERYRLFYAINPMAGIIEGFRSALIGSVPFPLDMLAVSCIVSCILFIAGLIYFRQVDRFFADVI